MESITTNNNNFKDNLTISRLYIGISYLNSQFLEELIQKLIEVSYKKIIHLLLFLFKFTNIGFSKSKISCTKSSN